MKDTRPIHLNLFQIKFPVTAIISILHRISGFILFFCIPLLLWALDCSLSSAQGFDCIQSIIVGNMAGKIITWLVLAMLCYHLLAGIRHLLMDWGCFETLRGGKISSWVVIVLAVILIILLGVWLW